MLRRPFHYHCSLMYAAVYDINYVADSVVWKKGTRWRKSGPQDTWLTNNTWMTFHLHCQRQVFLLEHLILPIVRIVHSYVYQHTLTYRLTSDEEYELIRNCSKTLLSDRPSASTVATSTEVKAQLSKVTFHSLLCFR